VLFAPREAVEAQAQRVLDAAAGLPGHIFNLGHGVLPDTDPEALTRLVAYVHEHGAGGGGAPC
jgi:uroporphyrinogen decarboxylase